MSNFKEDLMKIKAFAFDVDGVLSFDVIPMHPSGEPMRTANIKDGFAIQKAVKLGYPVAIITGGNTPSVEQRYRNLGVKDIYMASAHKIGDFNKWIEKHGLDADHVCYMGDDLPDYQVMERVGMAVCPSDAVEEIKSLSCYVSHKRGGDGCVRDVVEQVLRAHGKWGAVVSW